MQDLWLKVKNLFLKYLLMIIGMGNYTMKDLP